MKNILYLLVATILLASCSKEDPTANRAEINYVRLLEFPNQASGVSWDAFGGAPDPYIELYVGTTLKMTGEVVSNAVSPTSITWTPVEAIRVDDLYETIYIYVYDSDNLAADEYMAGMSFQLSDYKFDEPSLKELQVGDLKIELSLNWLYQK